ncbi:hypothetical protein TNCV_4587301 [Trichonephila clavipes]|nr:hypothetical protein TNCV_4587301 [Trichonephila clavipes]
MSVVTPLLDWEKVTSETYQISQCNMYFRLEPFKIQYKRKFKPSTPKEPCVGQRCMLNLSKAETSSRWCGVVVRRGGASSGVIHVT